MPAVGAALPPVVLFEAADPPVEGVVVLPLDVDPAFGLTPVPAVADVGGVAAPPDPALVALGGDPVAAVGLPPVGGVPSDVGAELFPPHPRRAAPSTADAQSRCGFFIWFSPSSWAVA
jgi:hypothetical protein